jgi:hypothetical protein
MLNGRFQDVRAFAYYAARFVNNVTRPTPPLERTTFWRSQPFVPGSGIPDPLDIPTLFFTAIAGAYTAVCEIGSANGERIIAIKRAHPRFDAVGLDLVYQAAQDVADVHFLPYALDAIPARSLVVSVGTLVCLSPNELRSLVDSLREKKTALAYFEPAPAFEHRRTFRRRSSSGYYHPYSQILCDAGFTSKLAAKWPHVGSALKLEKWIHDYWVPAA